MWQTLKLIRQQRSKPSNKTKRTKKVRMKMNVKGRPVTKDYSFMGDKYVKSWLTGLAERSSKNYRKQFGEVLAFTKMTPSQMIEKRARDLASSDIIERQYFELKFREFKAQLENTKPSHSTVLAYLKCYASFFARNGVGLNLKRGDWVSTKRQEVIKHYTPTLEEVKRLYSHAKMRDKALLLTLAQSGFSEIDVASLRIEDMPIYTLPENEHYFIEKPCEKSNIIQATCISYEAIHDLKEYLAERGNPQSGSLFESETYGKGEPMQVRTINLAMKSLYERTFGKQKAKEFRTKSLRSFYNSALLRANIQPQELKDVMMGHERASARKNYAYDETTIRDAYTHAFPNLSINGIQVRNDFTKFKGEINVTITQLSNMIAEMRAEWDAMKAKMTPEERERFTAGNVMLREKGKKTPS
jgi:integrase